MIHRISLPLLPILLVSAWTVGCGRDEPEVRSFEIFREGWDTLEVSIRFARPALAGSDREAEPTEVRYVLFSAAYDTLHSGSDATIRVPDLRLASEEVLLLEACGRFGSTVVCDQRTLEASPKRMHAGLSVQYPVDEEQKKGTWTVSPTMDRQRYGSVEWERADGSAGLVLMATSAVIGGSGTPLRFELRGSAGTFDLSRLAGYPEFRFDLRSAFRDSGLAVVRFEALSANGKAESAAGGVTLRVRPLSVEEQLEELSVLVEAGARGLVERLFDSGGSARALVFVNDWAYDAESGRYLLGISVHRRQTFGRWDDATGDLSMTFDGHQPVFRLRKAEDPVWERWRREAPGDSLVLPDLPDPSPERPVRGRTR